ncbi:MAG: hypothetical protein O2866_06385 [archaeon]|nr:hypothetical protein [archaeon]MDA1168492.1 hypothetical protein [archaeon]
MVCISIKIEQRRTVGSIHEVAHRFFGVDEGDPLTVRVGIGGFIEVKNQRHHQVSFAFFRRDGEPCFLGKGMFLFRSTCEVGATSLLTNVSLNGIGARPITMGHHLQFVCSCHRQHIATKRAETVKVEPMMLKATGYHKGLEPVGQCCVIE